MAIPVTYVARNLWARRLTTLLTASGLALVVFVFATVLMLDAGLKKTLVSTGEHDNVVVIRKGAETEIQSAIDRGQANVMEMHPSIAMNGDGEPLVSKETVVLISLKFDAGGSGFDSEIWGDVDQLMQSFCRTSYSSMVLRLANTDAFERFRKEIRVLPKKPSASKCFMAISPRRSRPSSIFSASHCRASFRSRP